MKTRRKKTVARPRVLWQVNPSTRVQTPVTRYRRRKAKEAIRKNAADE